MIRRTRISGLRLARLRAFLAVTFAVAAAMFAPARAATAQSRLDVLHTFAPRGATHPQAPLIQATDGNFYGTTYNGGISDLGTVFKMIPGGTVTILHAFAGGSDGALPKAALIQATDGNFYGTTLAGGTGTTSIYCGCGTVFRMTPGGAVTVLHAFAGGTTDGDGPVAALIQTTDGNFYGTTSGGGVGNAGTVFRMTPAGAVTVLHSFSYQTTDGANPFAALIQATDGTSYGTTSRGGGTCTTSGTYGCGTVFKMTSDGTVTVLHAFGFDPDGAYPSAALVQGLDGNLYGTTPEGGSSSAGGTNSLGTVFKMTVSGTVTILHTFTRGTVSGGGNPGAALIQATDGNFYGTTTNGAAVSGEFGTVFRMTPGGTVSVLHVFTGGATDGALPDSALLQDSDGNFYGTTSRGGSNNTRCDPGGIGGPTGCGTAFEMAPDGVVSILSAFTGGTTDGSFPYAALIQATDGNFYGTTYYGGTSGLGTVFRMTLDGHVTVLHGFAGGSDGAVPYAGLIQASDGNFYGTTVFGGSAGDAGTVFRMTPDGSVTVLHVFSGGPDGVAPYAALIQAADGDLYGSTIGGGSSNSGTIFKMTLSGTVTILHALTSQQGGSPYGSLLQASDGNFYGTTYFGGGGTINLGTVFKMTPGGTVTVLHTFTAGTRATDGALPDTALIQAADGNLYGTARFGGPADLGTIFKMTLSGNFTVLHSFSGTPNDGARPDAALIQASDGNFYGTTSVGGSNNGTIFRMTPSGTVTTLHAFTSTDGAAPYAALIRATDGNFYGTTAGGSASQAGVVFRLSGVLPREDLVIDFGGTAGVQMLFDGDANHPTLLNPASAKSIVTGDLDGNGIDEVIVDFGSQWGIWVWANNSSWYQLHPATANRMVTADLDGNGKQEVLIDFPGWGIWVWSNNTSWIQLHPSSPTNMVTGDLDGNGKADVLIDFPGWGIWVWANNTSWFQLHPFNARQVTVGDFDGNGKADVVVDFAGWGLWKYSNGLWSPVHSLNASHLAAGDVDGNGQSDLVVDFGDPYGIWLLLNGTAWSQLDTRTSTNLLTADVDGNGKAEVLASFAADGLWEYANNTSWVQLSAITPGAIAVGHINAP